MFGLSNLRIRPKLLFLFLITGVVPLLVVGLFGSKLAADALMEKSFNQLITVQTLRTAQLERFFQDTYFDLRDMAESEEVMTLAAGLNAYNARLRARGQFFDPNSPDYRTVAQSIDPSLRRFADEHGYHSLLLVDAAHGDVLFSTAGENDLGSNLNTGPYRNTGLAMAWRGALKAGARSVVDFNPYPPSNNMESAFLAEPVRDAGGNPIGVLVFQLAPALVSGAVDSRQGMGETGESYLLGVSDDQKEFELRSNLKTMGTGEYSVGNSLGQRLQYWVDAVAAGYAGDHGIAVDSAGKAVLVAYNKLKVDGLNWYLISKIDKEEVVRPIVQTFKLISAVSVLLVLAIILLAVLFSRSLTRPIVAAMRFAKAISEGELHATLELSQKDEIGDLSQALNGMAGNLHDLDWLKRGKEGLDDEMRGELECGELAKRLVTFMTRHLGAQLGALFVREGDVLTLQASYAFSDRNGNFNRIRPGEGMVGQAALENETILFSNVGNEAPALNYGAGEALPRHFIAVPISFEGANIGVLLLGSMEGFTPLMRRMLEQNVGNAAVMMNTARSRRVIRELLEKAQEQQEELRVNNEELEEQTKALKRSEAELQTQQEELRVTNEELEEQTKALKQSEAELQAQQEELRVTNEELEERTKALEEQKKTIGEKNAELVKAQEVVRQKAKDLEQASRYKSEFLANMSHELRTPLNSILILSQLLGNNKGGNLTEKQIESAQAIHSSGADLLSLINDILDLSKVEAGKVDLVIEDVRLQTLTGDLDRLFKDVAADKGVQFSIEVAEGLPDAIRTDSQRLQQILRNLLTNAFKFTSGGQVALAIQRPSPDVVEGCGLDPSRAVAFSVADNGIGIPKDKQEAIFQAFQQADGSTSRKYGGTGLGLSISRELSALLGGFIRLKSEEGQGSTFTVVIPETYAKDKPAAEPVMAAPEAAEPVKAAPPAGAARDAAPVEAVEAAPEKAPARAAAPDSPADGGGRVQAGAPRKDHAYLEDDRDGITPETRSLLIIEDDRNFAKIMRDFGRERGFMCLVAEDGETGLHFADYYKPSAIILDIGLPGIDGWTVMERLKENASTRHIPVHFMSANDSSLDAMRMGAIGFLSKPVSMEKVEDAFNRLEDIVNKPVSSLLLVEDDKVQRNSIRELIGNGDVRTTAVGTGREAFYELETHKYDCMILDLGLEDMSGFELLEKIRLSETAARVPVIIYTGRDLTRDEEKELNRYAESIIIKGVKSPERLLDESALFLHRVEANLPAEKQKMLKMVHDKEAVLSGKKILLVDDDMRNVFALSRVLEERNMDVAIAKNGLECLEKLEENDEVDCILMDIMMPKMDGYEAMRAIRKQRKFEKLPIIALTAKAMKGDRAKCIEAGASDYLAKPVNTDKLLSMMRVWLY